jgi:putative hemolysin
MSNIVTKERYTLVDTERVLADSRFRFFYKLMRYPLESMLGVRRLNQAYANVTDLNLSEVDFIYACARELGVSFTLPHDEELEPYRDIQGPLVVVSNHPFGGIESFLMVPLFKAIRDDFAIVANFMLSRIRELTKVLFAIDPYDNSRATKKNVGQMKKLMGYLRRGGMVQIFPAGEVSSYKLRQRRILDPDWNPNIFRMILATKATVVPLYFHGRNSILFQLIGFFNPIIRSAFLPREFVYPHEKEIRFKLGRIIGPNEIGNYHDPEKLAAYLRHETYALGKHFLK